MHVLLLHIIDPFGNYLCQKLMERCTDEQRTRIVEQVSQDLVDISLNMHGTRAVQKMIEYITLPEQVCLTCLRLYKSSYSSKDKPSRRHFGSQCRNAHQGP